MTVPSRPIRTLAGICGHAVGPGVVAVARPVDQVRPGDVVVEQEAPDVRHHRLERLAPVLHGVEVDAQDPEPPLATEPATCSNQAISSALGRHQLAQK